MDKRQLLCTFSDGEYYKRSVDNILEFYDVYSSKVFVFNNIKNKKEIFLTYNIIIENENNKMAGVKFPNTISIHRKKEYNVIFSLNALNILIKEENGIYDKDYVLNWELYRNSFIISGDVSVRVVPIEILDIISK